MGGLYEISLYIALLSGVVLVSNFIKDAHDPPKSKQSFYIPILVILISALVHYGAKWDRLHEDCSDNGFAWLGYSSYQECVDEHSPEWRWESREY